MLCHTIYVVYIYIFFKPDLYLKQETEINTYFEAKHSHKPQLEIFSHDTVCNETWYCHELTNATNFLKTDLQALFLRYFLYHTFTRTTCRHSEKHFFAVRLPVQNNFHFAAEKCSLIYPKNLHTNGISVFG